MRLKVFGQETRFYSGTGQDFTDKLDVAGYDDGLGRVVGLGDIDIRVALTASVVATNLDDSTAFASVSSTFEVVFGSTNSSPDFASATLTGDDNAFELIPGEDQQTLRTRADDSATLSPTGTATTRQLTEGLRVHKGLSKAEADARALELLRQVRIPEPE